MINKDKWMSIVPKINNGFNEEINQLDHSRWVPALPKKNTYGSIKKYSLIKISKKELSKSSFYRMN